MSKSSGTKFIAVIALMFIGTAFTIAADQKKQGIKIIAVNREYGFLVIDRGTKDGLKQGVTFKVLRNGQQIGRLRAVSVEEEVTIVDEIEGSMKVGLRIGPDDQIELEPPEQRPNILP
ncbi:MAG: hypothetical protein AAGH89_08365 [Verrucomicrobiota bacterium]